MVTINDGTCLFYDHSSFYDHSALFPSFHPAREAAREVNKGQIYFFFLLQVNALSPHVCWLLLICWSIGTQSQAVIGWCLEEVLWWSLQFLRWVKFHQQTTLFSDPGEESLTETQAL